METIFRPATALLGRLTYPWKIVLVNSVLLIPLCYVALAYVDVQDAQTAFSAKERDGVAYLAPLMDLTVRTVEARHAVVSGRPSGAGEVAAAIEPVNKVDAQYGKSLETTGMWQEAKETLARATATTAPKAAFASYTEATTALLTLIVRVSDKSNLTLDPDLDSYYVMDSVIFRLPLLLDTAGQAADQAILARTGTEAERDAIRISLAIASGTLTTTLASVDSGMATSFQTTASPSLGARGKPGVQAVHDTISALLKQITDAVTSGDVTAVAAAQGDAARTAVAESAAVLAPELDILLATRIGGFEANARKVMIVFGIAIAIVSYLIVGFYRSATPPLRRMVATLDALAEGDLTRTVKIDTRDEVGAMGSALNSTIGRVREAIVAIGGSASGVANSSTELSDVSGQLRQTAESTSGEAAVVRTAVGQVSHSVAVVAESAEQLTVAIQEISQGASEAALVAASAVGVAETTNNTVRKLGQSSAEIGDVVKVITTIAQQTNLLALNATIEAARAGEAGRGFAVVANEVKDLAQETARATEEITVRIGTIQSDTQAAVDAISEIGQVIGRINDIQSTIAAAVEEQTATTNEMSRSISEVASGAEDISGRISTVATSAEKATRGAGNTEKAAHELARTAEQLREIVGRFKAV